jgi:hypothetical protein
MCTPQHFFWPKVRKGLDTYNSIGHILLLEIAPRSTRRKASGGVIYLREVF